MPKIVRLIGNAPNLALMDPTPSGIEVWCCNARRGYNKWRPEIIGEATRWFNLHSMAHMLLTYPRDVEWYKQLSIPLYLQKHQPTIPNSIQFPREAIQSYFKTDGHYFTCSGAWLIGFSVLEGFDRIELHGFEIAKRKPTYAWERACMFYWINKARSLGVDVWYPPDLDWDLDNEAGDPAQHNGILYGFDTKPEADWNPVTKQFDRNING